MFRVHHCRERYCSGRQTHEDVRGQQQKASAFGKCVSACHAPGCVYCFIRSTLQSMGTYFEHAQRSAGPVILASRDVLGTRESVAQAFRARTMPMVAS